MEQIRQSWFAESRKRAVAARAAYNKLLARRAALVAAPAQTLHALPATNIRAAGRLRRRDDKSSRSHAAASPSAVAARQTAGSAAAAARATEAGGTSGETREARRAAAIAARRAAEAAALADYNAAMASYAAAMREYGRLLRRHGYVALSQGGEFESALGWRAGDTPFAPPDPPFVRRALREQEQLDTARNVRMRFHISPRP
jgi:hypothetical protein